VADAVLVGEVVVGQRLERVRDAGRVESTTPSSASGRGASVRSPSGVISASTPSATSLSTTFAAGIGSSSPTTNVAASAPRGRSLGQAGDESVDRLHVSWSSTSSTT